MNARHAALLMPLLLLGGCLGAGTLPARQTRSLDQVKDKVGQLRLGMSQDQVRRLLGMPARKEGNDWVYLPNRKSDLFLEKKLVVKFFGNEYVSHAYKNTFVADYSYPERDW